MDDNSDLERSIMEDAADERQIWEQGRAQGKREAADEIERLRALVEETIETLEAMNLHVDNPLYVRLRDALE